MKSKEDQAITPAEPNKSALAKRPGKRSTLIADIFSGRPGIDDFFQNLPPDLGVWAGLYLKLQVEGVKAKQTLRGVRSDLEKFIVFYQDYHHGLDMTKWLPRTTQRFVEYLGEKNQKPKTIHRSLITLKSFVKWILSIRPTVFSLGDPTKNVKSPTQDAMRPKGLTDRQVKQILDAAYHLICQAYPDEKVAGVSGDKELWYKKAHRKMRRPFRDYAIIMLLLNGGLRRSEICDLKLGQVKGKHLVGVKCKGNLYRDVLLGEETLKAIQSYLAEERSRDAAFFDNSDSLFLPSASRKHRNTSGTLSPRLINAIVEHVAQEANKGMQAEEHIHLHPHMFRHTHAYQILKKGRSLTYVQKRLGHQSMNYLALYTQMPEGEEKELLDEAEFK